MAITLDAQTISESTAPADPYTFSHTVGTGENTVLFVLVANRGAGLPTSVTYNGVGMTQARGEGAGGSASIWYLVNPTTGSNTVSIDSTAAQNAITALAVSFFGVDLTNPAEATNGANGTAASSSVDVTSITAGAWLLDVVGVRATAGETITQGAESGRTDWSPDWEYEPGGNEMSGGGTKYEAVTPAGAKTFSWTFSGSVQYGHAGVAVKPFTGKTPKVPWPLLSPVLAQ